MKDIVDDAGLSAVEDNADRPISRYFADSLTFIVEVRSMLPFPLILSLLA